MENQTSTPLRSKKRPKKFTAKEIKFIRKWTIEALPGQRMSARELALCPEMKRHTKESIATRIKRSGLADKKRSTAIKSSRKLNKSEKGDIVSVLRGEARYWPAPIVATRLNISVERVNRFRAKNGLNLRHSAEALLDPVYREWYEAKEKNRIKRLKEAFQEKHARNHRSLLTRAAIHFAGRRGKIIGTRNCECCGNSFPSTAEFFRSVRRTSVEGKKYFVLDYVCRGCPRKKRGV